MANPIGMAHPTRLTLLVLLLAAGCWGQNLLTVQVKGKQRRPGAEADKLYLSACSAVQRESGAPAGFGRRSRWFWAPTGMKRFGIEGKFGSSSGTLTSSLRGSWCLLLKTSCPRTRGWQLPGAR
jgi:hypothetical protein